MKFADIHKTAPFKKDLKRLAKRFPTIADDLEICIKAQLALYHKMEVDNHGIFPLSGLGFEEPPVFKVKKFACRSLKGKGVHSGIRVIYAYHQKEDCIELIQIYYKGDVAREDRARIALAYN